MPILYTLKATRPSLDHNFYIELSQPLEAGELPPLLNDSDSVILSKTYDEFISWATLWARKDELRSDIKAWLENNYSSISADSDSFGPGPEFNPLSLTYTAKFEFNTTEDVETVANAGFREDWQNAINSSENTVEESLVDASGSPLTDLLNRYKFS